jgi:hypothetical protein
MSGQMRRVFAASFAIIMKYLLYGGALCLIFDGFMLSSVAAQECELSASYGGVFSLTNI